MTCSKVQSILTLAFAVTNGCATIQSGSYGVPLDDSSRPLPSTLPPPLKVSATEISDASSRYFGMIEVTFENDSAAWRQIDRIDLDFGTPDRNQSVVIPWGDDVDTWSDAISVRNAVRTANTQMVLSTLAIVGAVGAAAGGHHGHGAGAAVGGVLSIGALGALYARDQQEQAEAASAGPRFANNHLLAMPIRVPPGLFTKRWILLNTAAHPLGGCIDRVTLGYQLSDQTRGRVLLNYKSSESEWQRFACETPSGAGTFGNSVRQVP
ncbi:MAG: hypothetical protein ABJA82_13050 [Myxococcales bacterium]